MEDTSGKSTAADLAITVGGVNNEPLCAITAPEEGSAYIIGQNISFSGSATDEDVNNSLLNISWESNVDGIFDTTSANTAGELGFSYADLLEHGSRFLQPTHPTTQQSEWNELARVLLVQ